MSKIYKKMEKGEWDRKFPTWKIPTDCTWRLSGEIKKKNQELFKIYTTHISSEKHVDSFMFQSGNGLEARR